MPRKKVDAKEIKLQDVSSLSFFKCEELIRQINIMAAESEGELTDEQINILIEAQTQSPAKLHALCDFLKMVEANIRTCKDRKKEINEVQKNAERTVERMKSRVAEWVDAQGKSYHAGEYELKTRLSTSVELVDGFNNPMFCSSEMVRVVKPDKQKIKEALEAGEEVLGATLIKKVNLTIK